jgi:hypothetical protein
MKHIYIISEESGQSIFLYKSSYQPMTSLAQYQLGHQRQLTTCYTNPWIVAITNIQVSTFTFLHNLCGLFVLVELCEEL